MQPSFDEISRRLFLAHAARSCLGVSVLPALGLSSIAFAAPTAAKAERVIYLVMSGGMSHLDTFDPKPGQEVQGPTDTIGTAIPAVKFAASLPRLAERLKQFSLVRSMTSNQGAHFQGRYLMRTSYSPLPSIRHPGLGAWVASELGNANKELPANIILNGGSEHAGAGFLDMKYAPLILGNPAAGLQNAQPLTETTEAEWQKRLALLSKFGTEFYRKHPNKKVKGYGDMFAEAVRLMNCEDVKAFDLNRESKATRDSYGNDPFGQGCLLARRLIEKEVRFVEVESDGWDTHVNNFKTIKERMPVIDQAVSALLDDLQQRGWLKSTLVVLTTEFGRSPKINERAGRDHHPAVFSSLIAGGGIKGGYIHGSSDERGHLVREGEVTVADFNATIAQALGIQHDKTVLSPSKRPFKIANQGQPVKELFA